MRSKAKWLKKGDFIIAAVIVLAAAGSVFPFLLENSSKKYCVITKDNVIIKQVELTNHTTQTVQVDGDYHNTVQIQDGAVWVSQSDCPNQLCVHSAPISHSGQAIVCLPNHVLVRIVSSGEQEVDVVVQ